MKSSKSFQHQHHNNQKKRQQKKYRSKKAQLPQKSSKEKTYKTTSHCRSMKYPAIADVVTDNMKSDNLFKVLSFLSKLQKQLKKKAEENTTKSHLNEDGSEVGASLEESLLIEEIEEFYFDKNSSPSSPNFGFRNPSNTLNDIINSPEFNKANLNNFPTSGDDGDEKSIHEIKKRKKIFSGDNGTIKPKFRDFAFPKTFDKNDPFLKKNFNGLKYNFFKIQKKEFKEVKRLSKHLKEKMIFNANVANSVHPDDVYLGGMTKLTSEYRSKKLKTDLEILESYKGSHLFMSILSVIALEPALIKRIVQVKSINTYGVYTIWINFEGFWQKIIIDDYFPMKNGKFRFAKINPKSSAIWPLLIEKAYAKCYGGYGRIPIEESVSFYLRDLTGAPVLSIPLEFNKDLGLHERKGYPPSLDYSKLDELQRAEAEEVWEILKESFEKGYIALATIKIGNSKKNYELAFPIINFICLKMQGNDGLVFEKYIQVKQIFGLELLPETSKLIKERFKFCNISINFEEEKKDKLIWMSFSEFLSYFNELAVAMVNPNHVFGAIEIKFNVKSYSKIENSGDLAQRKQSISARNLSMREDEFHESYRSLVKLTIWVDGEYTISFNKSHQEKYLDFNNKCKDLKIKYMSAITIGRLNNDRVEFIDSKFDDLRNTVIHREFEVGEYVILLDIRYSVEAQSVLNPLFPNWKNCSISTYGPSTCSIMELEQDVSGMENLEIIYGYFEHKIWKDFINDPPEDISEYIDDVIFDGVQEIEMINNKLFPIKCQSLSVNHLIIEVVKNEEKSIGLTFEKEILSCIGYEVIGPSGRPLYKNRERIYVNPGESEILLLRFGIGVNREFNTRMM